MCCCCVFLLYKGKHLPDEDNLLHVIAMRFVVAHFPHVSIAPHGFKDCIKYITHHEIEFVRDAPTIAKQPAAAAEATTLQQVSNAVMHADWSQELQQLTSKVKESSWWSSLFKQDTSTTTNTNTSTTSTTTSLVTTNKQQQQQATIPNTTATTTTTTTASKASFSLDDDDTNNDDGNDADMIIVDAADLTTNFADNSNLESDTLVKLDDLKQLGEPIHVFPCQSIANSKQERFLIVTNTFVMNIQNHPQMQGYGVILWKRQLRGQVLKLAYHKENNKILSIICKGTAEQVLLPPSTSNNQQQFQETLVMDKAVACAQLIQNYTMQLKKK